MVKLVTAAVVIVVVLVTVIENRWKSEDEDENEDETAARRAQRQVKDSIVVVLEADGPGWIGRLRAFHRVPEDAVKQIFRALVGLA